MNYGFLFFRYILFYLAMYSMTNTQIKMVKDFCGVNFIVSTFKNLEDYSSAYFRYVNCKGSCCVCLENRLNLFVSELRLYHAPCNENHCICHRCLLKLIDRSCLEKKNLSCPLCRSIILEYKSDD
jgi:hypothetical protein